MPSETYSPNSTEPQPGRLAMDQIVQELQLLYQPPKAVQEAGEIRGWLVAWVETILAESREPDELRAGWIEFKRTYERQFWPAPGIVCQVIRSQRAERQRYQAPASASRRIAAPDYHRPEIVTTEARNATLKALAEADYMARSDNSMGAGFGKALVSFGLAIINRNGTPRP